MSIDKHVYIEPTTGVAHITQTTPMVFDGTDPDAFTARLAAAQAELLDTDVDATYARQHGVSEPGGYVVETLPATEVTMGMLRHGMTAGDDPS